MSFLFITVNSIVNGSKESDRFIYRRAFSCRSIYSVIDWRLNHHYQFTVCLLYDAQTTSQSRKNRMQSAINAFLDSVFLLKKERQTDKRTRSSSLSLPVLGSSKTMDLVLDSAQTLFILTFTNKRENKTELD